MHARTQASNYVCVSMCVVSCVLDTKLSKKKMCARTSAECCINATSTRDTPGTALNQGGGEEGETQKHMFWSDTHATVRHVAGGPPW